MTTGSTSTRSVQSLKQTPCPRGRRFDVSEQSIPVVLGSCVEIYHISGSLLAMGQLCRGLVILRHVAAMGSWEARKV
jgi:hypothetical protein